MENTTSILAQSKKARNKKIWGSIILLSILGGGSYFIWGRSIPQTETIETVYDTVKIGNIENFIEESGKIVNANVVNLSFLTSGTLQEVNVEEGDKVKKGDVLSKLERQELWLDLQDAQNALEIVQTNIKTKESQVVDNDLITAANSLDDQKDSINSSLEDMEKSVEKSVDSGVLTLEANFNDLEATLDALDEILGIDQGYSKYRKVPGSFHDAVGINKAKNGYQASRNQLKALTVEYEKTDKTNPDKVLNLLSHLQDLASNIQDTNELMLGMFDNTVPTADISASLIGETESYMKSNLSKAQNTVSSANAAKQKIEDALLSQKNSKISLQNSLENKELSLDITKTSVEQKILEKANSLKSLQNQLRQAQVKVDRVNYNLSLTSLVAPVNGEVIQVNGSVGETVKADSSGGDDALIKILSESNFTTEVYVQEADIAKVQKDQKAKITLDAFEDAEIEGVVTYISSIATIDNNNITTYLVRVEITDPKDLPIKEGMTTYVNFVTESAQNVLVIPAKAVNSGRVQLEDGSVARVEVGITDGINIEIKSGLEEGQKIIVSGGSIPQRGSRTGAAREMTEERLKMLKDSGFTDEELKKMESGEFTDEMRSKMQKFRENNSDGEERRRPMGGGMGMGGNSFGGGRTR